MRYLPTLAAAACLAAGAALADTVNIGTLPDHDPGRYTLDPEALQGFEAALADELCQRVGVTCEWRVLTPDALWPALETGAVDAVMAGIPADAEPGDGIALTIPYLFPDPFLHIGLTGTEWLMEGAVVAYVADPDVAAYAALSGATFTAFDTRQDALGAVRSGQVLSLFGEREQLVPLAEASDGELSVLGGRDDIRIRPGVAMAFRADDIDLRFAFEDQIFEMSEDGSLGALTDRWFGLDAAQ